jgi:hypothetical protein
MSSNAYINTLTLEYPLHEGDIRNEYPQIGEVFFLPDDVFVEVEDTPFPILGENEVLSEHAPELVDGKWIRQFSVRTLTAEEIEDIRIYNERMNQENNPKAKPQDLSMPGSAPDVIA